MASNHTLPARHYRGQPSEVFKVWPRGHYHVDNPPKHLDPKEKNRLRIYYKYLPDQFYKQAELAVVTPETLDLYLKFHQDAILIWDFQEIFSGSAALSAKAVKQVPAVNGLRLISLWTFVFLVAVMVAPVVEAAMAAVAEVVLVASVTTSSLQMTMG